MKKILSILLVFCLAASFCLPSFAAPSVSASEARGSSALVASLQGLGFSISSAASSVQDFASSLWSEFKNFCTGYDAQFPVSSDVIYEHGTLPDGSIYAGFHRADDLSNRLSSSGDTFILNNYDVDILNSFATYLSSLPSGGGSGIGTFEWLSPYVVAVDGFPVYLLLPNDTSHAPDSVIPYYVTLSLIDGNIYTPFPSAAPHFKLLEKYWPAAYRWQLHVLHDDGVTPISLIDGPSSTRPCLNPCKLIVGLSPAPSRTLVLNNNGSNDTFYYTSSNFGAFRGPFIVDGNDGYNPVPLDPLAFGEMFALRQNIINFADGGSLPPGEGTGVVVVPPANITTINSGDTITINNIGIDADDDLAALIAALAALLAGGIDFDIDIDQPTLSDGTIGRLTDTLTASFANMLTQLFCPSPALWQDVTDTLSAKLPDAQAVDAVQQLFDPLVSGSSAAPVLTIDLSYFGAGSAVNCLDLSFFDSARSTVHFFIGAFLWLRFIVWLVRDLAGTGGRDDV